MSPRLTSKERVRATLARQQADRVPVNYSSNPGIDARLKAHFGLAADDHEGLRRALGVDFRGVGAPYRGPRLHSELPNRRVDPVWGWRTMWIEHASGGYWDYCDFALRDADEQTVRDWPMPSPDHFDYSAVPASCRAMCELGVFTGHAGLGDIINCSGFLFSPEQVLLNMATEDPAWLAFVDRRLEILLEVTHRTLKAADGGVDFLWMGEDLGTQIGPMIGLPMFRKLIRPRHQRFVDLARSFNIPVLIHCCGSSSWAFDDFVEMGIGAVDTLQPEAANMAPAYLKGRYGGRLAFHGCISTAGPVACGTVQDVVADCRKTLEIMMPGGGYCFAPTHSLQDNSPTENVLAMYDTARRHGWY